MRLAHQPSRGQAPASSASVRERVAKARALGLEAVGQISPDETRLDDATLRVARTIANLASSRSISAAHLEEAQTLRAPL